MKLSMFSEKVKEYLTFLEVEKNVSDHTLRAYRGDLGQLRVFWERIEKKEPEVASSIDTVIRRFIHSLFFKKISKATLARKISCLRSLALFLKRQGIIIPANFKSPRVERKLPVVLTVDEIFYLLDTIKVEDIQSRFPYRDKALFEILYATGVRCSELVNIRIQDIDFSGKSIRVLGKGKKERFVLFGDKARKSVKTYMKEERSFLVKDGGELANDYLFLNYSGKQITQRSVQRIFTMFRKLLKVDRNLTPHKVRHSFATHLLNQGADLRVVQELLGHATLATTEIYTQVSSADLAKMCDEQHPMNFMDNLISDK